MPAIRIFLRKGLHMPQDPHVNAMDDVVRPDLPISDRPHAMMIPGRSFEARPSIGQGHQAELAALRFQETFQMRRVHIPIRGPFLHRRRVGGHRELQQPGPGVPLSQRIGPLPNLPLAMKSV